MPVAVGKVRESMTELHELQQLAGALVDLTARPAAQVQRQADVLEARERRQQVEELEDEADLVAADSRQLVVGETAERFAVDADFAGVAVVFAALVWAICVALGLPAIVGIVAAILVLLAGITSGGYGLGSRFGSRY